METCATADLQLAFDGEGSLQPEGVALAGQASAKAAMPVWRSRFSALTPRQAPHVPLDLRADVVKTTGSIEFKSISGEIAGEPVEGSASFDTSGDKTRFRVAAVTGSVSLPALLGSLIAWQRTPSTEEMLGSLAQNASQVWPARGFALEPLASAEGEIALNAKELALGAPFQVEGCHADRPRRSEGAFRHRLAGTPVRRLVRGLWNAHAEGTGAELKLHAELATGRLDQLSQSLAGRVLAKGSVHVRCRRLRRRAQSPGLVAGLSGEGALFLDPGVLQALSPEPLKRVARRCQPVEEDQAGQGPDRRADEHVARTRSRGEPTPMRPPRSPSASRTARSSLTLRCLPAKARRPPSTAMWNWRVCGSTARWAMRLNGSKGRRHAFGESRPCRVSPGPRRHHLGGRHGADGDLPHRPPHASRCRAARDARCERAKSA